MILTNKYKSNNEKIHLKVVCDVDNTVAKVVISGSFALLYVHQFEFDCINIYISLV